MNKQQEIVTRHGEDLSDYLVPKGAMRYDQTKPCSDCPFTSEGPADHMGVISKLPLYCDLIQEGELVHTCHKTDAREQCDGARDYQGDPQHCVGALMLQAEMPVGTAYVAASQAGADLDVILDNRKRSNVFLSVQELLQHYLPTVKRMRDAKRGE